MNTQCESEKEHTIKHLTSNIEAAKKTIAYYQAHPENKNGRSQIAKCQGVIQLRLERINQLLGK